MERSERWGIWAVRGAGSIFGPAADWLKVDGKRIEFSSAEETKARAFMLTARVASANVHYLAARVEE